MKFDAGRYFELAPLAFSPSYCGYRPNVIEAPNGDGKLDEQKQFSHLALKYFDENTPNALHEAFWDAYEMAANTARALIIPKEFHPDPQACALRLLRYPAGAGSEEHTDFDLFTMNLWRNDRTALRQTEPTYPGIHYGELMPLMSRQWGVVNPTTHYVQPRHNPQYSMVFFALPNHQVRLEDGRTVGQWLEERIARSRY